MPQSDFAKNVLTLMTGTTIAQAIPLAISPILARLYTQSDFGVLAIFVAVISILGSISSGRYELAIMQPKKDEDAINIFALGFIILSSVSLLLTVIVLVFHNSIVNLLDDEGISFWLYFVPITVFFIGLFNLLNYFNNRQKNYKDLAKANVLRAIVLASIQLSVGFIKKGATGLISGQIISQLSANMRLLNNIIKDKTLINSINKRKIISLAKTYSRFPKYDLWSILFNVSATQIPVLLIADQFSVAIVGLYAFAFKIITTPSSLIGSSISQVFYQSSAYIKDRPIEFKNLVYSTYKKLLLLAVIPFSILAFYADYIFGFVFGKEWIDAGIYTQILSPWLLLAFIASPLSTILLSLDRQDILLKINIALFVLRVSSVIVGGLIYNDIFVTLSLLALSGVVVYLLTLRRIFMLTQQNLKSLSLHTFKYVLVIAGIGASRYILNIWL